MRITELEGRLTRELRALANDNEAFWEPHHFAQCGSKIILGPHVGVYIRRRGRFPTKTAKEQVAKLIGRYYAKTRAVHPTSRTNYSGRDWWRFDVSIVKPKHWAEPKPL